MYIHICIRVYMHQGEVAAADDKDVRAAVEARTPLHAPPPAPLVPEPPRQLARFSLLFETCSLVCMYTYLYFCFSHLLRCCGSRVGACGVAWRMCVGSDSRRNNQDCVVVE